MQTIRITITSENPANIVLTERKPEKKKGKRKRSSHKRIEDLLRLMPKQNQVGLSEGDEQ